MKDFEDLQKNKVIAYTEYQLDEASWLINHLESNQIPFTIESTISPDKFYPNQLHIGRVEGIIIKLNE